jgi:phosphoglycolate/pyridoxal phosphate phosphatase family enzyme
MIIADRFEGFIVDLDGVVWVGDRVVPGAAEAIGELRRRGKRVLFVTNDPRSSRQEYAARLTEHGIPSARDDVLTSGAATAEVAARATAGAARAFVVGSQALKREVQAAGLTVVDGESGRGAEVVVVGGHDGFDYHELRVAASAARGGATLYATGRDATFPMPDGPWPATGALVAAIETASGARAIAVGKPEPHLFEVARERLELPAERIAVVGDTPGSDIAGGRAAGMAAILVLTGNARREDLSTLDEPPVAVLDDLGGLFSDRDEPGLR